MTKLASSRNFSTDRIKVLMKKYFNIQSCLSHFRSSMFKFRTASSKYAATKCLPVYVEAFESETYDGNAAPYIMSKTSPSVLSVGLRVMHQGFSFIWLAGKTPAMITPNRKIVPSDVDGDICT